MKNKKIVLVVIIALLIVILPPTIFVSIEKLSAPKKEDNPNHEFKYLGYLWFYNDNDEFLSKYECMTEICDYASPIIDDVVYETNYYQEGNIKKVGIIDGIYTFITDGDVTYLYNVTSGFKLQGYRAIKNYNTTLDNNNYIIQNNDNLWGVLTIGSILGTTLPFEYDFIGIINRDLNDDKLSAKEFVVLKEDKWQIISNEKAPVSSSLSYPIVDYNNKYIFTKDNGRYHIFDYEGQEYVSNIKISEYYLVGDYIGVSNGSVLYIYKDLAEKYLGNAIIANASNVSLEVQGNNVIVYKDNEILKTIEVN